MELIYYLHDRGSYDPIYEYKKGKISEDEIFARQLCTFFIKEGIQYKLICNEGTLDDSAETITVEKDEIARNFYKEKSYPSGIHIEFREYKYLQDMPVLHTQPLESHWEAIKFLLKDIVHLPGIGECHVDSTEIDEDRQCYVFYIGKIVKET
ncbi:RNA helicase [Sutcliffiella horikoshii]|uniref:RNA helicase n=1 Tax=Sutcliffiella horikoshii TaxID=79883 RepID=UPI001CFC4DC8|nr:RNA helicase [Sutcliffiella horikoshii]